jgi:hypothetical protein
MTKTAGQRRFCNGLFHALSPRHPFQRSNDEL